MMRITTKNDRMQKGRPGDGPFIIAVCDIGCGFSLYKKKYKKFQKKLAIMEIIVYTNRCCDMIAMKREVAAERAGFPWSECQVRKLTTSHCTSSENHPGMGAR